MKYLIAISQQGDDRISVYAMDAGSGDLTHRQDYALAGGPAPMALDPMRRWIIVGTRARPGLATIRLSPEGDLLPEPNWTPQPVDPCYVSMDASGRYVLTAHYAAGRAALYRIGEDGTIASEALQWIETE